MNLDSALIVSGVLDEIETALEEEELNELEANPTEDSSIRIEQEFPPLDQSPEEIADEVFDTDFWEEPVISRETGQISAEYSALQDDMTDLVEELQAHRKGDTSLLPDLDGVLADRKKGSDWLDEMAEDSDVTDDLPEWLYETVGFTDQLPELPEEGPVDDNGFGKPVDAEYAEKDKTAKATGISASDAGEIGDSEQIDWDSEWPDIDDAAEDDDLPKWLLDADEVLEELPDEVSQASADSWLQSQDDEADDVGWLDELVPKDKEIADVSSGEKLVLPEDEPPALPTDDVQEMLGDAADFQADEIRWPRPVDDEQDHNAAAEKSDDGG